MQRHQSINGDITSFGDLRTRYIPGDVLKAILVCYYASARQLGCQPHVVYLPKVQQRSGTEQRDWRETQVTQSRRDYVRLLVVEVPPNLPPLVFWMGLSSEHESIRTSQSRLFNTYLM